MWQQCIIIGNVGRNAELSYTPQGIAVAKFTVAVGKITGKGDDRKEKTTWFRVVVWRDTAEIVAQYVKKGMRVQCVGEIGMSVYTNKNTNEPAGTLELTANSVQFLSQKEKADPAATEPVNGEAEEEQTY